MGKIKVLRIYAFSSSENTVDWSETNKLYNATDKKGKVFKEQGEDFQKAFARHVELYGFAYFKCKWHRYRNDNNGIEYNFGIDINLDVRSTDCPDYQKAMNECVFW